MDAGPAVRRFPLARPRGAHTQRARIPQTRSIVLLLLIAGICQGNERCDDPREGDPSRPRILLPLNGSFLEAGQGWLFVDAQDEQGPISCSINGREFAELASSRPIKSVQLPRSLAAGTHRISIRSPTAANSCVWVTIYSSEDLLATPPALSPLDTFDKCQSSERPGCDTEKRQGVAILHPLTGSAFFRSAHEAQLVMRVEGCEDSSDCLAETRVLVDGMLVEPWASRVWCTDGGACLLSGAIPSAASPMQASLRSIDLRVEWRGHEAHSVFWEESSSEAGSAVRAHAATVWDGKPAAALGARGTLLTPAHASVLQPSGQPAKMRALVEGAAIGPGAFAVEVRLDGRCLGTWKEPLVEAPLSGLGEGTHHVSVSLVTPSGLVLPPSAAAFFKVDSVQWPDLGNEAALPRAAEEPQVPQAPSGAVWEVLSLEALLDRYSRFHAAALQRVADKPCADPPGVLLYTPPAYGWGNRVLDCANVLLLALLTDRVLLFNWTMPLDFAELAWSPLALGANSGAGSALLAAATARGKILHLSDPSKTARMWKGGGGASITAAMGDAPVVALQENLRALPALIYADPRLLEGPAAAIFSLLPPNHPETVGALAAYLLRPSRAVRSKLVRLRKQLEEPYLGVHLRRSGSWDPRGSSELSLFGLQEAGVARAAALVRELLARSRLEGRGVRRRRWWEWGQAQGRVLLATDCAATRERGEWREGRLGAEVRTGAGPVAHTAGEQRSGATGAADPLAAREGVLRATAEWWALAGARAGWVLTRGSSFGLTAALVGAALGGGGQAGLHTVSEHKVQRGPDCRTFEMCVGAPHGAPARAA